MGKDESCEETGTRAFIGLGSNMGRSMENCIQAITMIAAHPSARLCALSSLYATSPVSDVPQDDFTNGAVAIRWGGSPLSLLKALNEMEDAMGRVRRIPWGPRIIDLDILLFGDTILEDSRLSIPHPRLHERKFALVPCLEIDSLLVHPLRKKPLSLLLAGLDDTQKISLLVGAQEVLVRLSGSLALERMDS